MAFWLNTMLADPARTFGKGNVDTTHRGDTAHYGQSSPDLGAGVGHIDPRFFVRQLDTSGLAKLANDRMLLMVAIHETTHAYGRKIHGGAEGFPFYVSPYFIRLNDDWGGPGQCIK
jgi:hypothetical protein